MLLHRPAVKYVYLLTQIGRCLKLHEKLMITLQVLESVQTTSLGIAHGLAGWGWDRCPNACWPPSTHKLEGHGISRHYYTNGLHFLKFRNYDGVAYGEPWEYGLLAGEVDCYLFNFREVGIRYLKEKTNKLFFLEAIMGAHQKRAMAHVPKI